ncbi:MAG: DUF1178 family protein [Alphaproteobacteria bacterium]|nr:DUF1178 family protein [Alphaproteobacteria bacterium]
MIRYALRCACGHGFDAWFASAAAYDAQADGGLVACPACGANTVDKALMTPAIGRARAAPRPGDAPAGADTPPPGAPDPAASPPDRAAATRAALRALIREVKDGAEDVGTGFAAEARRIHDGEAADRPIWGRATGDDARALREDGIDVQALPDLPEHDA